MSVRKMLFVTFRVSLSDCSLTARLAGEGVDAERHGVAVEPKGATVTALKVDCGPDGQWLAQCVIDV
jgi:SHS2 domain-containing protein